MASPICFNWTARPTETLLPVRDGLFTDLLLCTCSSCAFSIVLCLSLCISLISCLGRHLSVLRSPLFLGFVLRCICAFCVLICAVVLAATLLAYFSSLCNFFYLLYISLLHTHSLFAIRVTLHFSVCFFTRCLVWFATWFFVTTTRGNGEKEVWEQPLFSSACAGHCCEPNDCV